MSQEWQSLSKGMTIGKTSNLFVNVLSNGQINPNQQIDVFNITPPKGKAESMALNLGIKIMPPKVLWVSADGIDGSIGQAEAMDLAARQQLGSCLRNEQSKTATRDWYALLAVLEWGVGGTGVQHVEVDVRNGCSLSLTADYLRMYFRVDDKKGIVSFPPGNSLWEVGGFIGPGRSTSNPRRTVGYGTVQPVGNP